MDFHGKQAINFQLSVLLYSIDWAYLPSVFLIFASDFISFIQTMEHNIGEFSMNNIQNLSGYIFLFRHCNLVIVWVVCV